MRWPLRIPVSLSIAGLILGACFGLQSGLTAQARQAAAAELEVPQLRPNFFLIAGAGGHIGVQVGDEVWCWSTRDRVRAPPRCLPRSGS